MTLTDLPAGNFVVSAKRSDGFIQQTRKVASGAIDLALTWHKAGHTDITVIDPRGEPLTPETYQEEAMQRIEQTPYLRP